MTKTQRRFQAARKKILKTLVASIYRILSPRVPKQGNGLEDPKRILLLNGFHVGDVVIATSVIPILRSAYPSAEIGFVVGSWSQMVLRGHRDVKYIHCVDHWTLNRGSSNRFKKFLQYRNTRRKALKEIRALEYDVAISLFTNFPDFLNLTWAAKIPVRIGFRNSVFSSLATSLVDEPESPFVTQGQRLAEPLRALPIDEAHFQCRHSSLASSDAPSIQEICSLLGVSRIENVRYRVIHMGSGALIRELPLTFWRELAERISPTCKLLFTGRGAREMENVEVTIRGLENCVNACNRLTWEGFVAAVRHAEVLYGVESMAGHVAGAVGTKCVVVYGGTAGVGRWRPEGSESIVVTNHVPCAPCLQSQGCPAMTCMQGIKPDDLIHLGG